MNYLILAVSVIISWTYPAEIAEQYQVTHFTLYMGVQSVVAGNPAVTSWDVSYPLLEQQVDGLEYGQIYYFATKTWNAAGPSEYSGELVWTPLPEPTPQPTPLPTPEPTPEPTPPLPTPVPTPTPMPTPDDGPGLHKGWYK